MLPDLHWHTRRCGHAGGRMEEFVAAARRAGITHGGFADHIPIYWLPPEQRDRGLAMDPEELPRYVLRVRQLQDENPALDLALGIEADYIPGFEGQLAGLLSGYPFDYVIGSVHYLDGWGFDNPALVDEYARRDVDELYRQYFALLQRAAASGLFDVLAHPDLIKKFGCRPQLDLTPLYEETARVLADSGICLEVNTAGLAAPAREIYPALKMLEICRRYGVPATTGSDAHQPQQVGRGMAAALSWLQQAGYREVAVFKGRRRRMIKI
ncbi:histidinol-phosphatase HisJ family protein [Desulfotomaculum copahuensis]|uniref:Histidinol-phosphatase n=1 Tax=Desulfotomaculum copahuensis TaxID=1838280 RepID=A0A1B7LF29_9FIRM|nr:histidinol-phosphatase HisJ family protein [Desulfotomaculum copahuensis]OAT81817.1 histidinol-phosphatase [Desulfotomaculum copahuensis]